MPPVEVEREKQRIRKLAGFQMLIPGRRLPIVKIRPIDYSPEPSIQAILKFSKTRLLVLCHGRTHPTHPHLPRPPQPCIYLDLNPVAKPDILGDIRHKAFMNRLPANYFQKIYLTYLPPPKAFHWSADRVYRNLKRILQPKGQIISHYTYKMLARERGMTKTKLHQTVPEEATRLGFSQGKVIGTQIILIK